MSTQRAPKLRCAHDAQERVGRGGVHDLDAGHVDDDLRRLRPALILSSKVFIMSAARRAWSAPMIGNKSTSRVHLENGRRELAKRDGLGFDLARTSFASSVLRILRDSRSRTRARPRSRHSSPAQARPAWAACLQDRHALGGFHAQRPRARGKHRVDLKQALRFPCQSLTTIGKSVLAELVATRGALRDRRPPLRRPCARRARAGGLLASYN